MNPAEELETVRAQIDEVDTKLLALLKQRFALVDEVAALKQATGMATVQPARFEALLAKLEDEARVLGLPPTAVRTVWEAIHEASVDHQNSLKAVE